MIKPSKTITEKVTKILEDEILSGIYKPGDRLVESRIAGRLGVSRVPVREALLNLEKWGFVRTGNNRKGREVVGLSKREISENYAIRALIECHAFSELSLQKERKFPAYLRKMIGQMEEAVSQKDLDGYRRLNSQFHLAIVRRLNNRKLYEIYRDVDRSTRWFQNLTLYVLRMEKSIQEHKLLLEAHEKRDLQLIRKLFQDHYGQAVDVVTQKLEEARKSPRP
jgi:DNA-binding GntR family transcriptional regulator